MFQWLAKQTWAVCTILFCLCDLKWKAEIILHGNYFLSQFSCFFLPIILHDVQSCHRSNDRHQRTGRTSPDIQVEVKCKTHICKLYQATTILQEKEKYPHWKFSGFYIWELNGCNCCHQNEVQVNRICVKTIGKNSVELSCEFIVWH